MQKFFAILPLLGFALFFCSCHPSKDAPSDQKNLCFQDDRQQTICLAHSPERVLSLAPSHTEWLFALNAQNRIAGRTDSCNRPQKAEQIPSIGHLFPPDYERILAARPDLVLMLDGQSQIRNRLNELGLPVASFQPKNFEDLWHYVHILGDLLDAKPEAEQILFRSRLRLAALQARHLGKRKPSVFFTYWADPLSTAGANTFLSALIQEAGGRNLGDALSGEWPKVSPEFLLQADPDFILTTQPQIVEQAQTAPGWQSLKAVKNGHLYLLEDEDLFLRPSPRIAQAVARIFELIHK